MEWDDEGGYLEPQPEPDEMNEGVDDIDEEEEEPRQIDEEGDEPDEEEEENDADEEEVIYERIIIYK